MRDSDGELDRCVGLSAALYCALMLIPIATTFWGACNPTTGDIHNGPDPTARGRQRDVARRFGVSQPTVSEWARGVKRALSCGGAFLFLFAQAQAAPVDGALMAARICFLEADFRKTDCSALLHTARKRDPRHWLEAVIAYSAPALAAKSARAEAIRAFPDGDVPGAGARFNRQWAALRAFVADVFAGHVKDPCPNARYFGGTMDSPVGAMVPAKCAGATANAFYAVATHRGRR